MSDNNNVAAETYKGDKKLAATVKGYLAWGELGSLVATIPGMVTFGKALKASSLEGFKDTLQKGRKWSYLSAAIGTVIAVLGAIHNYRKSKAARTQFDENQKTIATLSAENTGLKSTVEGVGAQLENYRTDHAARVDASRAAAEAAPQQGASASV